MGVSGGIKPGFAERGFFTAVVLTGSHGAGDPSETLTPLVAWGAGVRSAEYISPPSPTQHSPQGVFDEFLSLVFDVYLQEFFFFAVL